MKFNGKAVMASVLALGITTVASVADASISASKRPLQTYTSQRVYCGNNPGATSKSYWIDANVDLVKITEYSGTWAKGTYPNSKGVPVSRWFNMANVLGNINYSNWTGKANRAMSVYRMNSGSTTIGSVPNGEPLEVVSESNGRYQVIYVLANGAGYKMGWVPTSYVSKPVPPAPNPVTQSLCYPVDNPGYDYRQWGANASGSYHVALDFYSKNRAKGSAQTTTPIKSIADGTLVYSGYTSANGNSVVIKHNLNGKDIYSFYAHLNSYNVYAYGQQVRKGQTIGYLGNTGSASNGIYHLHFSIADRVKNGTYYGYINNTINGNTAWDNRGGVRFYNPKYVLDNGRLP